MSKFRRKLIDAVFYSPSSEWHFTHCIVGSCMSGIALHCHDNAAQSMSNSRLAPTFSLPRYRSSSTYWVTRFSLPFPAITVRAVMEWKRENWYSIESGKPTVLLCRDSVMRWHVPVYTVHHRLLILQLKTMFLGNIFALFLFAWITL